MDQDYQDGLKGYALRHQLRCLTAVRDGMANPIQRLIASRLPAAAADLVAPEPAPLPVAAVYTGLVEAAQVGRRFVAWVGLHGRVRGVAMAVG